MKFRDFSIVNMLALAALLSLLILPTYSAEMVSANSQSNDIKNVTINLTAKNSAFNTSTITVPAGSNVTISFDNLDTGVEHNFALYETAEATKKIYDGDEIVGPAEITYNFIAPDKPGTYFFRCDDHPEKMTGQFVVQ